ncbi:hypothetical protein ABZ816_11875 [Actinosynnema sp. NPDC047251]|uniref:Putative membrane protein n=1 Tax=Saccharothrix espanaensis (strain ATCC 51144 / DSM 44229 / JCM 9112 / NBRC 15066 / NRRL 15764) TaxID=1179773 RepID=K0K4T7_SACES|nr:hypothetical protein [Saccharothrix espanaensis]CCH35295.1 putative membrane protein [Saccharothrix espanaensis DSM 44229]
MTAPPSTARAAVALWFALAAFGLLHVGYLWLRRDEWTGAGQDGSAVTERLVQLTTVALVCGAGYVVFALLLRRRTRWARGALTAVAVLHVLWIVLTASAGPNLVLLLLIGAGLAFTWLRGTAEWVTQH